MSPNGHESAFSARGVPSNLTIANASNSPLGPFTARPSTWWATNLRSSISGGTTEELRACEGHDVAAVSDGC